MAQTEENWDNATEVKAQTGSAWNQEEPLVGKFIGTSENVGPNLSKMHNVRTDSGEVVGMWGSSVLDSKMAEVTVGDRIRVSFEGRKENPKTKHTFKDYKVMNKGQETVVPDGVFEK